MLIMKKKKKEVMNGFFDNYKGIKTNYLPQRCPLTTKNLFFNESIKTVDKIKGQNNIDNLKFNNKIDGTLKSWYRDNNSSDEYNFSH